MALEITKNFMVQAPAAKVWDFLVDVEKVAKCLPGAAITGKLDDKTYNGTMTVKVGPVQASYKGKVVFESVDAGARTAQIVATGQDVRGRGGADLRLTSTVKEVAPGRTEVTAVSQVSITGILAQMGRGMIQDVSDQMFQLFSERMRSELETAAPAAAPPPAAPAAPGEALDVGAIGAKAAGRAASRTLRRPAFWVAVGLAIFVWLIFR
jgi:carbon monoxide dehydrogenase subunit G